MWPDVLSVPTLRCQPLCPFDYELSPAIAPEPGSRGRQCSAAAVRPVATAPDPLTGGATGSTAPARGTQAGGMTRPPPPLVALGAGLAQRVLAGPGRPGGGRAALAAAVALASAALPAAAISSFRRVGTTVEPFRPEEATTLVTDGVYTVTRNPMYVGLTGVLVAHALWRGSWAALLPAAGFVALMDRTQVAAEEAALRATFGDAFVAYERATPRWLDGRSLPRA